MFGGYAWLTNAVPPRKTSQQLLILVGMSVFLVVALATPDAFGASGPAFGVGYLVVTLVHTGLFLESTDDSVVHAIRTLGPFNIATAAIIVAGGFTHGTVRWSLWVAAFAFHWLTPYLSNPTGIGLRPAHFVERHGLILLIAIGESVVAVGIGLHGLSLSAGLLVSAILGLAISAAMWWLFFDKTDEQAEMALTGAPTTQRAWMALYAFGYSFLLVIPGIVVFAAGVRLTALSPGHTGTAASVWFLAGGVSAYCAGLALVRLALRIGRPTTLLALAAAMPATVPAGLFGSGLAQLGFMAALLLGGIVVGVDLGLSRS